MKKATRKIAEVFPGLEELILNHDVEGLDDLDKFDDIEVTFLKLARFFENPDERGFDLTLIYQNLKDDLLELALKCITEFFQEDTAFRYLLW